MIYTVTLVVDSSLTENDVAAAFNYCTPGTDHLKEKRPFDLDILNTSIKKGE